MNRSVEVFVVDTPRAASVALGVARADAESTHVLCRHADEATSDFMRRVLRRIARIRRHRGVRSLWYVVGSEAARASSAPLLHSLVPLLESDASLTVVAPGGSEIAVFGWIDSLIQRGDGLAVRAQLYADGQTPPLPRRTARRTPGHALARTVTPVQAQFALDRFAMDGVAPWPADGSRARAS